MVAVKEERVCSTRVVKELEVDQYSYEFSS